MMKLRDEVKERCKFFFYLFQYLHIDKHPNKTKSCFFWGETIKYKHTRCTHLLRTLIYSSDQGEEVWK